MTKILANILGSFAYVFFVRKKRVLRSNLSKVISKEKLQKEKVLHRIFCNYAYYFLTLFKFPSFSPEDIRNLIKVEGLENLEKGIKEGRGIILITAHLGHWDLGGAFIAQRFKINVIAEPLKPNGLFDLYIKLRESQGINVIKDPHPLRRLISILRQGGIVGLLCDREMRGKGLPVPFFGEETPMSEIPAFLALRTGAKIIPGFIIKENKHYRCIIKEEIGVEEDIYSTTLKITKLIEDHIRSFYDNWYMFQPIWKE